MMQASMDVAVKDVAVKRMGVPWTPCLTNLLGALALTSVVIVCSMWVGNTEGLINTRTLTGIIHFLIGYTFFFSSPAVRGRSNQLRVGAFFALSIPLTILYYAFVEARLPVLVSTNHLLVAYFCYHMVRDEVFFYGVYRTALGIKGTEREPFVSYVRILAAALLICVVTYHTRQGFFAVLAVMGGVLAVQVRRGKIRLIEAVVEHRSLLVWLGVLSGVGSINLLTTSFNPHIGQGIIIYHFMSWYVFYVLKLRAGVARIRGVESLSLFKRIRVLPGSFATMVIISHVLMLGGLFIYLYGGPFTEVLRYVYADWYFAAWSIPHITIGFLRRPS